MPTLVPCLVRLRTEFNTVFPGRDKRSDGWIGDPAHQSRASDHNPDERGLVHAIDVDADLGEGVDMTDVIELIVARCKSGAEKRLTYIIWDRGIWSVSRGWARARYTGDNPHTAHAHLSASSLPARENNTSSWHLEEVPVALTPADKDWIAVQIKAQTTVAVTTLLDDIGKAAGSAVHNTKLGRGETTIGQALQGTVGLTATLLAAIGKVDDEVLAALRAGSPEQTAEALKAVLGDQAVPVGRILSGLPA